MHPTSTSQLSRFALTFALAASLFGSVVARADDAASIRAAKVDTLLIDRDGDGHADPGDTLRYRIEIRNDGSVSAEDAYLRDAPDRSTRLVAGSVSTSHGTVFAGNGVADSMVDVAFGSIATDARVVVTFDVVIDDPLATTVSEITSQAEIFFGREGIVVTDDPSPARLDDPTVTAVAVTITADASAAGLLRPPSSRANDNPPDRENP